MTHKASKFLFLVCIVSVYGCRNTETDNRRWIKGNLHTQSYWSDGDEFPEMIRDWYKTKGYNFVGLSDHNILAEEDKWIKVVNSGIYEDGFQKYLSKYDADVFRRLQTSTDARLKYAIYKTNADFLLVSIGIFDQPVSTSQAAEKPKPAEEPADDDAERR